MGEFQREVEEYLAQLDVGPITVDGVQTAEDCDTIASFQSRYDIRPPKGRAGPLTHDVAKRLATTQIDECDAGPGTTICVDLTRQTMFVLRDGELVMEPAVTRTGMAGFQTPAGTFRIDWRNPREWSEPYRVWLPYWQHFVDGMGFHETTTYLHNQQLGSHGCVNLLPGDAERLWELGEVGTTVYLYGRRPGT